MNLTIKNIELIFNNKRYCILAKSDNKGLWKRFVTAMKQYNDTKVINIGMVIKDTGSVRNKNFTIYYDNDKERITHIYVLKTYANNIILGDNQGHKLKLLDMIQKMDMLGLTALQKSNCFTNIGLYEIKEISSMNTEYDYLITILKG